MIVSEEVYLAHHGVRGMKWGVRRSMRKQTRAAVKAGRQAEFDKLRKSLQPKKPGAFDKSTPLGKAKAKLAREADIQRARTRISTGALAADKKAAKAQFKQDKVALGRSTAKKILKTKKAELQKDVSRSQEFKDGKELTAHLLNVFATALLAPKAA